MVGALIVLAPTINLKTMIPPALTNVVEPPVALTAQEVYELLRGVGFPQKTAISLVAVSYRESRFEPWKHNSDKTTGDNSYGLLQINWASNPIRIFLTNNGIQEEQLLDPKVNVKAAFLLWNGKELQS